MLKRLITRYKNSEFLVNITKLGSATTIAQFISVGTAPILYRIYDKSHYGTLGLYMAITGVIGVFSTLQYLQTILLEKEDEDAINAMWLNRTINTGFALLTLVVILILFPLIIDWVNNPSLNKWLWFIPVSIFFGGQKEIFTIWANRKKEYNLLTFNTVFMSILTPVISIGLGYALQNETGLFTGLIVGQSLPTLILFLGLRKKYELGFGAVSFQKMKNLAIVNKKFPIYSLPGQFISRLGKSLPVFLLTNFFGVSVVGEYNLANRILGLPSQIIGNAVSTVFSKKATEHYYEFGNYNVIFKNVMKLLAVVLIIPLFVMILFGEPLFAYLFGLKWSVAGKIASILSPVFALGLLNSSLSYGFYIHKLLRLDFLLSGIFLSGSYICMRLTISSGFDYLGVIISYSIFTSLMYIILLLLNYKLSKKENEKNRI